MSMSSIGLKVMCPIAIVEAAEKEVVEAFSKWQDVAGTATEEAAYKRLMTAYMQRAAAVHNLNHPEHHITAPVLV